MDPQEKQNLWGDWLVPAVLVGGLALLLGINAQTPATPPAETIPLQDWLKLSVRYLGVGAELAAGLVIGAAVIRATFEALRQFIKPDNGPATLTTENIRLRLGRTLALGLEFTVASDILQTAVAPTRQDILNLAAVVLLRSLLNYFLEREIRLGEVARKT